MDFSSEAKMYGNFGEEKKSWVQRLFGKGKDIDGGMSGGDRDRIYHPVEGAAEPMGLTGSGRKKTRKYEDAFDHDFSGAGKFTDAAAEKISSKLNISTDKAKVLIVVLIIIAVLCVFSSTVRDIVLYIPRKLLSLVKEGFTMIETPNGILSEDLTVDQNGYLSQNIGYGDHKQSRQISIAGIPDAGVKMSNAQTAPYPEILDVHKYSPENYRRIRERYTTPDGYRVQGNRQYYEDPLKLLAQSMTESADMATLQSIQNNIMMVQAKNIGNTDQTQELDTMKQLQLNRPMALYDVQATEEANKYQQKLENTQNFYNQSIVGNMQLAPNQDLAVYSATSEIPVVNTTINSGNATEPAYGVVPAVISPEFETPGTEKFRRTRRYGRW